MKFLVVKYCHAGFCCLICEKVMNLPLTTPCAHNFCKPCLETAFAGQTFAKERVCQNGRKLRSQKNVLKCPACPTDISEFLQNPQVYVKLHEQKFPTLILPKKSRVPLNDICMIFWKRDSGI